MADRTQEARERVDVQADINVVLDTLLKADEIIEWYRRQTGGTRALAVLHAIDALGRIGSEAYDSQAATESALRKMARLRHADEVLDGYERDLEDLRAKLHAKHDRVVALETALRYELWVNHGCGFAALYGDDGEMSCGMCGWDFKRSDVLDTIEYVKGVRLKRAAALAGAAAQEPQEGYRERPITEDFYEHNGEWVYRWNDERWVLRAAAQEPPAEGGDRG